MTGLPVPRQSPSTMTTATRTVFPVGLVVAAGAGLLAAGVLAWTIDPRLGVAALAAPVGLLLVVSPPIGTALVFFALPLDELSALVGGGALNKAVGVAVVGGWLLHALLQREAIAAPLIAIPLAGFVLWGAVSTLWAFDPSATIHLLTTYVQLFCLYLLVVNVLRTPALMRRVLYAHVAGATVLATFALYLTSTGVMQRGRAAVVVAEQLLVEPNACAAALILPIAICLTTGVDRRRGAVERLLLLAAGAVCLTALLLTESRGAVVGLGVAALFVTVAHRQVVLPALVVLLAVPGLLLAPPEFWQRWSEGATLADRGAGRLDIWTVGWVVFREHPLLGVGLGCFPLVYYQFLERATGISWKHAEHVAQVFFKAPHNIYVGAAAELGCIGLGLLLLAIVLHLGVGLRTWRALAARHHPSAELALTALAALIALVIQAGFFDVAHRKYLWATLGMAALGARRAA